MHRAGAAQGAGKADEALKLGENALAVLRRALDSYATVVRDRSDIGAVAVMDEYAYRPLKSKIEQMEKKP